MAAATAEAMVVWSAALTALFVDISYFIRCFIIAVAAIIAGTYQVLLVAVSAAVAWVYLVNC